MSGVRIPAPPYFILLITSSPLYPMDCILKTENWIKRHGLIRPEGHVLAAASGGPDSMAMLEILRELAASLGFRLSAAHFNHGIRPESGKERDLVAEFCEKSEIELLEEKADVPAMAGLRGEGLEETARKARYSFLHRAAETAGADRVATGHTLNDQAETILHHIIRGSGLRGLEGIPVRRGILIRPVMGCEREELKNLLKERSIPYALDRSNLDNSFLRNRIRNQLLPMLRRDFNPSMDSALIRLAENVSEGLDSPRAAVDRIIREYPAMEGAVTIPLDEISRLGDFGIYLLVDRILADSFEVYQDIEKCHFDSVKKLVRGGRSGATIELPRRIEVRRDQRSVQICHATESRLFSPVEEKIELPLPGRKTIPELGIKVTVEKVSASGDGSYLSTPAEALLGGISLPLTVRSRKPGDRMVPFGMKGSRKLSDIMIDSKIPLGQRDRIPVFEDRRGIIWVPGVAAAEEARIGADTGEIVRISIKWITPENPNG